MAVGQAFRAVDMSEWYFLDSDSVVINGTDTTITETDSVNNEIAHYFGNFTANPGVPYIEVTGGTMTGADLYIDGVRQFNVTGFDADALTIYNYLVEPTPADALAMISYLFRSADTLTGSSFADVLNGFGGNDTINGKGGADRINGGSGNDTMIWGAGDTFNGGAGMDTLRISSGNVNLTATANSNNKLLNTEQIDLRSGAHTLTLNKSDVLAMSPTDQIKILGDGADTVNIVGTQSAGTPATVGFTRYTIGTAVLIIDSDINVI